MELLRQRLILEAHGCSNLNNIDIAYGFLRTVAKDIGVTLYSQPIIMKTPGQGLTGVAILLESAMILHTWPEYSFLDFYLESCKEYDVDKVKPLLNVFFMARRIEEIVNHSL